jgi:hypothetical protein
MPLFNFALKAINDIEPWGGDCLHWFGLTDGNYYIDVGDVQLFRYSAEILAYWTKENPELKGVEPFYVDYQVVRLYEDLLEILPDILQPVPAEMQCLIADERITKSWELFWQNRTDAIEEEEVLRESACYWWWRRRLTSLHLTHSPIINIWRVEDNIIIRWNNQQHQVNGLAVWSTQSGEYKMPLAVFMAEVKLFHNNLMVEMKNRVALVATNNPIANVKIDIDILKNEQLMRENSLAEVLNLLPQEIEWAKAIEANKMFWASKQI